MEIPHEAREAVVAARNDAGYAHQMAEGLARCSRGCRRRGLRSIPPRSCFSA